MQLLQRIGIFEIDERGHPGYDVGNELCRSMSALDQLPDSITVLVSISSDLTGRMSQWLQQLQHEPICGAN